MITLSRRYLVPLSACLLVALVPVTIHSYLKFDRDDCAAASGLFAANAGGLKPNVNGREQFQSFQMSDGSFVKDGVQFDYSIVRSYDPKRLYHRPENTLVRHDAIVEKRGIDRVQTPSGELPIHRAYYDQANRAIVVSYLLVFRSSPVASPYWPHLSAAPIEVFTGRLPMTLFFIKAEASPGATQEAEAAEREWLVGSWRAYREACR